MALNIALVCAEQFNMNLPHLIYFLAYIMDYPSIWITVLFQKIPFSSEGFQFLTVCVTILFSAFAWAVLFGFIFRRKSIAEKPADTTK
jgi:hypothetical protein